MFFFLLFYGISCNNNKNTTNIFFAFFFLYYFSNMCFVVFLLTLRFPTIFLLLFYTNTFEILFLFGSLTPWNNDFVVKHWYEMWSKEWEKIKEMTKIPAFSFHMVTFKRTLFIFICTFNLIILCELIEIVVLLLFK